MKIKLLLIITTLSMLSVSTFAKTLVDSIGIENLDGKKVILHKLDAKDNYYSIGRRYNIRPQVIMQFNNNASLIVGNIIKVPTEQSFLQSAPNPTQRAATQQQAPAQATQKPTAAAQGIITLEYKVSAGETLYSIAKRFDTTVDDITKLNNLTTTIIPGQILKVRSGQPAPVVVQHPVVKRDSTTVVLDTDSGSIDRRIGANKFGLFEKNEKGVATWIDDPSLDAAKKLALHRTAPIGTVIKITNPMTGRTTFAKVVGRINDSEATKDVIIVMTKNVAESIGALDKRVHVNISYGSPNE
ncbi:MAG: LysM peptidoglycan-binding domain-containing protein [Mucilaginibacter sp.]